MDTFTRATLDSLSATDKHRAKTAAAAAAAAAFDAVAVALDNATKNARSIAATAIQTWAEMDPESMEEGETLPDALWGLLSAAVDVDSDGELDDDEAEEFQVVVDAAWDYLLSMGVSDDDCSELFDDESAEAAERVIEMLREAMGDEDEAAYDAILFAMSPCPEEGGVTLDGVSWAKMHRGRTTLNSKHGKKNVVKHRMKWRKSTAMQKAALRKNSRRAFTSAAKMMNRKSNMRTRRMGGRRVV